MPQALPELGSLIHPWLDLMAGEIGIVSYTGRM